MGLHDETYQFIDWPDWLEDQDFDLSAMMRLLPILESQVLIEDGKVSGLAEFTYGSCENEALETMPRIAEYGQSDNVQKVLHHFPQRDKESKRPGFGCCTCKGAIANQFVNSSAPRNSSERYPFRAASSRKVVYQEGVSYSHDASELANLHMCPFASFPFSTAGHMLTSQDALMIDASALNKNMLYVVELVNEVRDFAATEPPTDTPSRRLLSGLFPLGEALAGRVQVEHSGRGYAQSSGVAFVVEGPETNVDPADTTTADKVLSFGVGLLYCFFLLSFVWPCKVFYDPDFVMIYKNPDGKDKATGKPEHDRCATITCFLLMSTLFFWSMFYLEHDVLIIPTALSVSAWLCCFVVGKDWFTKDASSNDWVSFEGRARTEECPKAAVPTFLASMILFCSLFYYIITIWVLKAADPSNTAIVVINSLLWLALSFILGHRYSHILSRDAKDPNENVALLPDSNSAFGGKFGGNESGSSLTLSRFSTTKFKV